MKQQYLEYRLQFFTATIQEWTQLLKEYKHKNVIVDSFKFIVMEGNVTINGFVPIAIGMPNHLHITCLPAGRHGKQKAITTYKKYKTVL